MIKFNCKKCGQMLSVPEAHAGKKGKCPKCKKIIVIPEAHIQSPLINQTNSEIPEASSKSSSYDSALLAMPHKDKIQEPSPSNPETSGNSSEYNQKPEEEDTEETTASRKLPWFIDIFLYPLSISGLIYLVICFCTPILINLINQLFLQQVWPINDLIVATLYVLFVGYVMYY
ncbi:MAG: hypothetical protein ACYS17_15435, partial [Planctomycetota bacterium]